MFAWTPSFLRPLMSMQFEGRLSKEDYEKFGEEFRAEALVFIKEFREEFKEEQKLYEVMWGITLSRVSSGNGSGSGIISRFRHIKH